MPSAASIDGGYLPMGLASDVVLKSSIPAGQPLRYSDVDLDETSQMVTFRREMETAFRD